MRIKKIAGTAAVAVAMTAAALGLGAGSAQADQIWVPFDPEIPWGPGQWVDDAVWIPGVDPPGHNPFGPPGQVKKGNPYVP